MLVPIPLAEIKLMLPSSLMRNTLQFSLPVTLNSWSLLYPVSSAFTIYVFPSSALYDT